MHENYASSQSDRGGQPIRNTDRKPSEPDLFVYGQLLLSTRIDITWLLVLEFLQQKRDRPLSASARSLRCLFQSLYCF